MVSELEIKIDLWRFEDLWKKKFVFENFSFLSRIFRSVDVFDRNMWSIWSFFKIESVCVGLDSRFQDLSLNFGKIVILEKYVFLRFLIKLIKLLLELRFLLSLKLFLDWFRAEWYKFCKDLSKNRHFWVNFWIFLFEVTVHRNCSSFSDSTSSSISDMFICLGYVHLHTSRMGWLFDEELTFWPWKLTSEKFPSEKLLRELTSEKYCTSETTSEKCFF